MKRARNYEGKGMATAGLVLSIVFLAIGVVLAFLLLSVFSLQ